MRVFLLFLLFGFISPVMLSAFAAENAYICPMHPHISGAEGETCPICAMSLVSKMGDKRQEGAFKIDPSYVQALGVKTAEVTHYTFGKNIRAYGKMAPSMRLEHSIDVRAKCWVVDLATDAFGDSVKKGDLLFTLYSPELMEAQSDFLIGRQTDRAEQRLRLYGMDDQAISELKKKGDFLEETPFYAPMDGTVSMLNVRKGTHVEEGGGVMRLQDFSKLWVNVDVPLRDVQFLSVGTYAKITVAETGKDYETVIGFIHPVADPKNRLAVPVEAVLYSSMGAYVMENVRDGYFRPVMVETGITSNGLTEILSGLTQGQCIVTSGQFMLDAESNLRGGMAAMGHDHGEH